jgi:predicted nucleotidyltransferase
MVAEGRMAVKKIELTKQDQQALKEFVSYLRQTLTYQIEFVALFGSKARGDSNQRSDIDVLVILTSEDRELRREILRQAARVSLKYDVILSPRVIGAVRWEKMRGFSLYENFHHDAAGMDIVGNKLTFLPV